MVIAGEGRLSKVDVDGCSEKLNVTCDSSIKGSPLIGISPIVPSILSSITSKCSLCGGPPPVADIFFFISVIFFLVLAFISCQVYNFLPFNDTYLLCSM